MSGMPEHMKYKPGYYLPPTECLDWARKDRIEKAPIWCSVDLRDGNQALVIPMSLNEKLEFFQMLVDIGFKEIEIGFPAANDTEYELCRTLIEQDLIPEDVTIQVLTQAREHIIRRTFEALEGCTTPVIVHVYNSVSVVQREQVFRKSREDIKDIAIAGARLLKDLTEEAGATNYRFEYSPESFTGTEPEYATEVCNAVLDVWQPTPDHKAIINLPVTVEMSLPHVYAQQVEYVHKNLKYRDAVDLSLHPHNDRGTGVACTELGILAGADRVEGTLFGNGERTGNVDLVTVGMNLFSHGVDPKLDFTNIPELVEVYERVTGMDVQPRQPYSGSLVFAAFSGSHQDAIAKGLAWREEHDPEHWTTPYLPIDPTDIGRHYESDVIRINSQSGKGGVGYILRENYGFNLPKRLSEEVSYLAKDISIRSRRELVPEEVLDVFVKNFVNLTSPIKIVDFHFARNKENDEFIAQVTARVNDRIEEITGVGNGRLNAITNALKTIGISVHIVDYSEHALTPGSTSMAISYVAVEDNQGRQIWGVGEHGDIITASVRALVSAVNRKQAVDAEQ